MTQAEAQLDHSEVGLVYEVERSRLEGKVQVSGAKNSVLRLLAASLLTREPIHLTNYPASLRDAKVHVGMLEALGKACQVTDDEIVIRESAPPPSALDWPGRSIRNTLLILGALTARTGAGAVPVPGGCDLGDRKYDIHIMLLERLGARVYVDDQGRLATEAPNGLTGTNIHLPLRSTAPPRTRSFAARWRKGSPASGILTSGRKSSISSSFFARWAPVSWSTDRRHIEVHGSEGLDGTQHHVIADNMEALTWLVRLGDYRRRC